MVRLHTIWYIHRRTPDIKRKLEPRFDANAASVDPEFVFGQYSWEALTAATEALVPPVGQAGQPVRSEANLTVIIKLVEARLLQWGLVCSPDEVALSAAPPTLIAPIDTSRPLAPFNAKIVVDMSRERRGRKRPRTGGPAAATAAAAPAEMALMSAADLETEYGPRLERLEQLLQEDKDRVTALVKAQLLARAGDADVEKRAQHRKRIRTLLVRLREAVDHELGCVPADQATASPILQPPAPEEMDWVEENSEEEKSGEEGEEANNMQWVCASCGQEEPPEQATVECRRCFARVPREGTEYDNGLMHFVCAGQLVDACKQRCASSGRGARKRRKGPQEEPESEVGWLQCDGACARWFHAICVGVTPSAADEWLCHECLAALPDADVEVLPEE